MKTKNTFFLLIFSFAFAAFFFLPVLAEAATEVSGTLLSDTTWTSANSPYIVAYTIIPAGITLTIEEGTVVKFSDIRATIEVNGNLHVRGTEAFPVHFTSINDNTVGGDTGTGTPAPNDWGNIIAKEGGVAEIDHALIRYGGYTGWQTSTASSNLYNHGGTLTVSNSTISNSSTGLTHSLGITTLQSNIIAENSTGVFSNGTGKITFIGNTFLNNTETPAFIDLSPGIEFVHSGNTATGNKSGFYLWGMMNADYVFEKDTMPYVIGYVEIPNGKTVTARAGTVFKFASIGSQVRISGKLNTEGTEIEPTYFTSIKDDTIGGDTNGDANATTPAQNDWAEMVVLEGGEANFDHAIIRYGGQYSWGIWSNAASLANRGGILNISNSNISSGNIGVRHLSGTTAIASSTISENTTGMQGEGTGLLTFTDNTFRDNVTHAYFDISGGFTFTNSGNIALGTGNRGLMIRGTVTSDQIFEKDTMPYLVSYISIPVGKTLTVRPGAVIKMASIGAQISVAGTLDALGTEDEPVYFTSLKDDTIGGDTNGDGDATTPAPTDWAEIGVAEGGVAHFNHAFIRYGGQYSWGIFTNNAELANRGGTLDITNSQITYGDIGVHHSWGITTVSQSSIHQNDGYGIYNAAPEILHAENNWWGGANGPYHPLLNVAGIGNSQVSNNVAFSPWLGSDPFATSSLALGTPTETEDDGNQDAKGVADKTKFTFSVAVDGVPDVVKVIATSMTDTFILYLVPNGDTPIVTYTATSTFPKGKYTYHFEATTGTEITKTADQHFTTGYSNVAFLPGLEASRLYRPEVLSGRDEDQLWEPNISSDVEELFLNEDGKSIGTNIYTRDPIDELNILPVGQGNIYKSFLLQMEELKSQGAINDWEAIPYDWRLSLDDILVSGKKIGEHAGISDISYTKATSSPYIIQEIERLAQNSDTGKVTIIAHSNGGLLAKRLTKKLEEKGEGNITDKIILVAVPQSGTPEAVGALLNGFNQNHFPVLDTETARTFGENMPSAYNLLPSESYFNGEGSGVQTPPVKFLRGSQTALFRNMYGNEIGNFDTLQAFLRGMEGRTKPESSNVTYPNVLNPDLLTDAYNTHIALDSWTPPLGVKVYQIAGWGVKTVETIKYKQGSFFHCLGLSPCISYEIDMTEDGDGTVVVPSALAVSTSSLGVMRYWVNLKEYNDSHIDRVHKDILEVGNLRDFLGDLTTNADKPLSDYTYLSIVAPPSSGDKKLSYFLHSPLSLDLYDDFGNHTGISTTTGALENGIPGAYYREFGEVKYVTAPASTTLHLVMNGQATGYFTLDIQETIGDTIIATTTFEDIPSATSTRVAMDFTDGTISNASNLRVDENGDGTTDFSLAPKTGEIVVIPKPTLTVTPDNKTITFGSPIPPLTTTLSPASNDITGTPNCTTTATATSTVGNYPIICIIGTLASNTYDFTFVAGTLAISYRFDGFLQPINDTAYHPTQSQSVFKGGSTVPVKFQIKKSDGTPIQANTLPVFAFQRGNAMSASVDESTYSYSATTGSTFRWDSTSQQYIYNWSTKGVTPGYWYKLSAKLDDGKTYSVAVGLR